MMIEEVKKYICERLLDIRDRVKNIRLTYIYEKELDYHTIIVEPTKVFDENALFHQLEKKLIDDLFAKYKISDILLQKRYRILQSGKKK